MGSVEGIVCGDVIWGLLFVWLCVRVFFVCHCHSLRSLFSPPSRSPPSSLPSYRSIFGLPLDKDRSGKRLAVVVALLALSVGTHVVLAAYFNGLGRALLCMFLLLSAAGTTYFVVVAPNHDTYESVMETRAEKGKRIDWGEQQVRFWCNRGCRGQR